MTLWLLVPQAAQAGRAGFDGIGHSAVDNLSNDFEEGSRRPAEPRDLADIDALR